MSNNVNLSTFEKSLRAAYGTRNVALKKSDCPIGWVDDCEELREALWVYWCNTRKGLSEDECAPYLNTAYAKLNDIYKYVTDKSQGVVFKSNSVDIPALLVDIAKYGKSAKVNTNNLSAELVEEGNNINDTRVKGHNETTSVTFRKRVEDFIVERLTGYDPAIEQARHDEFRRKAREHKEAVRKAQKAAKANK